MSEHQAKREDLFNTLSEFLFSLRNSRQSVWYSVLAYFGALFWLILVEFFFARALAIFNI